MKTINIIVVDDSAANGSVIQAALEKPGVNVYATHLPEVAIQMCIDMNIDIALIDVNMPKIDGYELLARVKSSPETKHIMVILITGYAMNTQDVLKGLSLGAMDYLFKPMDLYITAAKIDALITIVINQREIHAKNIELEEYQAKLLKAISFAEQNKAAKENFLANMSHEIRTPLNAIIGLTHILKTSPNDFEHEKIVGLLEYSGNSLLGIVNDVLEISKIEAGELKINKVQTNLQNLIDNLCDTTKTLAEGKNLKLICHIDDEVPKTIVADSLRLNQILINLINNAIKFTQHGSVNLTVGVVEKKEGQFLLDFEVRDTGVGIPDELLDKIFQRYQQLEHRIDDKLGSSGLGLSIVKKLIELKGGKLNVTSKVGEGSVFTYRNWYKSMDNPVIEQENASINKYENISCLLVDDNEINRFVTSKLLADWNIEVHTANDGLEAFSMAENNYYDLILMDLYMPVMNGFEASKKIRKLDSGQSKVPILAFSATIQQQDHELALASGINEFLQKPFKPFLLNRKIGELLSMNEILD